MPVFAQQTEQQELGFNIRAAKCAGFVAGKEDDPACLFCISLEHAFPLIPIAPLEVLVHHSSIAGPSRAL